MRGKTTLTLGLLGQGFRYFSDDVTVFHKELYRMVPLPKSISVRPESLPLIEGCIDDKMLHKIRNAYDDSLGVHILHADDVEIGSPCNLRYFFFLGGFEDAPRLEPMPRARAITAAMLLSLNNMIADPARAYRSMSTLGAALRKAECYELHPGPLDQTVDVLMKTIINA